MVRNYKFVVLFLIFFVVTPLNIHHRQEANIQHEVTSYKTPLFGSSSGGGFSWTSKLANAEIREISGRKGWYIDQIKVRTQDGSQEESSPSFGGYGGGPYTWKVPEGEYINKILYRQGAWLDGVTFVTNKGTQSPQFGGNGGGGPYTYNVPQGARLNGIYGYKGSYLLGLGFTYRLSNAKQTGEFGNSNMGSLFSWVTKLKNAEVREVSGRYGWYIDQIKVRTADRVQEETSPSFGGNGGGPYTWKVPEGEHIAKIEYRQGSWLDAVTFITNKGTRSPQFGGNGGSGPYTYNLKKDERLIGFYGHKDQWLRGLGFYIGQGFKTVTKTKVYGDYNTGTKFEWIANDLSGNLDKIISNAGWTLEKIKFVLRNGEESPVLGHDGGESYENALVSGERVTKVIFRVDNKLDSVSFGTNKDKQIRIGGVSVCKDTNVERIPNGAKIVGLYGSYDSKQIISLGLVLAS